MSHTDWCPQCLPNHKHLRRTQLSSQNLTWQHLFLSTLVSTIIKQGVFQAVHIFNNPRLVNSFLHNTKKSFLYPPFFVHTSTSIRWRSIVVLLQGPFWKKFKIKIGWWRCFSPIVEGIAPTRPLYILSNLRTSAECLSHLEWKATHLEANPLPRSRISISLGQRLTVECPPCQTFHLLTWSLYSCRVMNSEPDFHPNRRLK